MNSTTTLQCQGTIKNGPRKGDLCLSEQVDKDGYCNKHQRDKSYALLLSENKTPCRFYFRGCDNICKEDEKTCQSCIIKKRGDIETCCHDECNNKQSTGKYCQLHIRDHYRDYEKEHKIKLCNIALGCFNICIDGFNACRDCIIENYKNNKYYTPIKTEKCIMCLNNIVQSAEGSIMNHCNTCYSIFLDKNKSTIGCNRNSKQYYKNNIHLYYNQYIRGATIRYKEFKLTLDEFTEIISKPCYYCNQSNEYNINGIDRVDNNKGYLKDNIVACCFICNRMKHTLDLDEFISKLYYINYYIKNKISLITNDIIIKYPNTLTSGRTSYASYKRRAIEERKKEFTLTEIEYNNLLNGCCYLCGIFTSKQHSNGIDRFNNNIGYIIDNCRTCCGHCNNIKNEIPIGILYHYIECILSNKLLQIHIYRQLKDNDTASTNSDDVDDEVNTKRFSIKKIVGLFECDKEYIINYCKQYDRSSNTIEKIIQLYNIRDTLDAYTIFNRLKSIVHAENKAKSYEENTQDNKKHKKTAEILALIKHEKVSEYLDWYNTAFGTPSPLFIPQINDFITKLPSLTNEEQLAECKHLIKKENLRRNNSTATRNTNDNSNKVIKIIRKRTLTVKKDESNIDKISSAININEIIPQKKRSDCIIVPKQWKTVDIYTFITTGKEDIYKTYCEENNTLDNNKWNAFITSVKSAATKDDALNTIKEFVEDLRRIRHNALCYNKNAKLVDAENREQWPSCTVLRAYRDGKIEKFKEYLQQQADDTDTVQWITRWNNFVKSLEDCDDVGAKEKISKFMTAERTRRYRKSKRETAAS